MTEVTVKIGPGSDESSIIALDRFIQATRDSGYKGTASAISELVDNALQAEASRIEIAIEGTPEGNGVTVSILDNGVGMDAFTLRQALRFGGSSRFDDRSGLGRYGMGLPNASLSQAKRVTVYTWQREAGRDEPRVYSCYLDVDEIVRGAMTSVPRPKLVKAPPARCKGRSGTLVQWSECDRLDHRRVSTLERKLASELGRRFRYFLWKGTRLAVNGAVLRPVDPLCVHADAEAAGATIFSDEEYEVRADPDGILTGRVRVRFSELPVHEWHRLSNEDKRARGISKGAGVSLVRAEREVDHGWFFMGAKRRENYDDWWRCEILFEPVLDEAFGITHTKQQVRARPHLIEALSPDIETTARILNSRARKAHNDAKASERFSAAETVAKERDRLLKPLPAKPEGRARELMRDLQKSNPAVRAGRGAKGPDVAPYRIVETALKDKSFFRVAHDGRQLVVAINPEHPFYREIYRPLIDDDGVFSQRMRAKLDLVLLAAARAEAGITSAGSQEVVARFVGEWSNTIATYLND